MKDFKIKLEFQEPLLGTASANPELYEEFIASKAPEGMNQDELDSLPDVEKEIQKGTTIFHRNTDDQPVIYDYQIKGFFKDACGMLRRVVGTRSKALKAYKKEIDGLVFVTPRRALLVLPEGGVMDFNTRPLRAQTAQGERVSLARSEQAPIGTTVEFEVSCLRDGLLPLVEEWLDYGKLRGLGQWRNASYGRFTYTIE